MYSPPNENLLWTVHRIRSTFVDQKGNERTGLGTGFWMTSATGVQTFVTNKHNVDPFLRFGNTEMSLVKLEIELRRFEVDTAQPVTEFFAVSDLECLRSSANADCSVLVAPRLELHDSDAFPLPTLTKFKDLATLEEFQKSEIKLMETAVFIGFPGANGRHWWDETWKLPVARECTLASWPGIPFTNTQIETTDVLLVSGLSFSGSSGSPVFVMNRGIRPGGDILDRNWRAARLIGVMSGHFDEEKPTPPMFAHSGLSYLTRSTSIIEILSKSGVWE